MTEDDRCDDCPPLHYPTDKTRCLPCPLRTTPAPPTAAGEIEHAKNLSRSKLLDKINAETVAPEQGEVTQLADDLEARTLRLRRKGGGIDNADRTAMLAAVTALRTLQAEVERQTEKALTFKRYWDNEREACRKARDERDGLEHRLDEMTSERDASEQFNGECEARATAAEAREKVLREALESILIIGNCDTKWDAIHIARKALSTKEPSDDRS